MDYGVNKRVYRSKLPLQILRGHYLTEPAKLTSLAAGIDDEAIKEGMILVKDTGLVNGTSKPNVWRKAAAADATVAGTQFFVAVHDQDSFDVQASGGLVGLNCSDDFELASGYFTVPGGGFTVDMPLTCGADGVLVEATTGDIVIAIVTAIGGGAGNVISYQGMTPSTLPADSDSIQFRTALTGVLVPV